MALKYTYSNLLLKASLLPKMSFSSLEYLEKGNNVHLLFFNVHLLIFEVHLLFFNVHLLFFEVHLLILGYGPTPPWSPAIARKHPSPAPTLEPPVSSLASYLNNEPSPLCSVQLFQCCVLGYMRVLTKDFLFSK